jgi:hypothetical protein
MQNDNAALLDRIERLERSSRGVRRTSFAIAVGGLFLGLAGMAAPSLCDTLYAERLVLRDPSGKQRIVADAYGGAPTFSVLSKEGRAVARLGVAQDGDPYLTFFDPRGAETGTWKGSIPSPRGPETKAAPSTGSSAISMR